MADWSEIEALKRPPLTELFAADADRLAKYSADIAGIHFDWSKTHLTDDGIKAFERLAKASDLAGKREALFTGQVINTTEDRAVTHTAERGEGSKEDVATAQAFHARMRALIDAIEQGALGPISNVLNVGIGGGGGGGGVAGRGLGGG